MSVSNSVDCATMSIFLGGAFGSKFRRCTCVFKGNDQTHRTAANQADRWEDSLFQFNESLEQFEAIAVE